MRRGAKPAKAKVETKPSIARKARKSKTSRVNDLEKHLAEALKREAEALEQQTATSEILRVISSSATELGPVLDTVAANAARVCDAEDIGVFQLDGDTFRAGGRYGTGPKQDIGSIARIRRDLLLGRTFLERRTIHVHDMAAELESEYPGMRSTVERFGMRTMLCTPLLSGGKAVGVIVAVRYEVRPFADKHIRLLETFADQAVIAIENVRLFNETKEALEQQTASSEILRVISSSPTDVQPVFEAIARSGARLCDSAFGAVFRFDGSLISIAAHHNWTPEILQAHEQVFPMPPHSQSLVGRAILERNVVHVHDIATGLGPEYPYTAIQRALGARTNVFVPMLRDGQPVGVIVIYRQQVQPFSESQIALLQTFADQAVIAIENVRLFKELEARNRDLTATSEVLQVISRSPTDVQPVFDTIARNARRLCNADSGGVLRLDGGLLHLQALDNATSEGAEAMRRAYPNPVSSGTGSGRAILTGRAVHIPDVLEDPEYELAGLQGAGLRSVLSVPMLLHGTAIGVISVHTWATPRPFTDQQMELLRTFADQAVIAIENVRLFKELEARTSELTQSVEKLTALGEVSRAVSSTLDVETVLDTIVTRASQLASAEGCSIFEYDAAAEQFELRATHNSDTEFVEALRAVPLRKGEGLMGRAAEMREPIQVPDIIQPGAYESSVRDTLIRFGYRALLSVPLLREDQIIGSLSFNRKAPGEFPPEVIDVLKTFATQSALAIQNARLFREIADKSAQLEAASRHKSEFLANMSHELRTPAQRDHRFLRGAERADVRGAEREAGRVPEGHPRLRAAPAVADQRHSRSLEGRGGADGVGAHRLPPAGRHRQRPDPGTGAGEPAGDHARTLRRRPVGADPGRRAQGQAGAAEPPVQRLEVHA